MNGIFKHLLFFCMMIVIASCGGNNTSKETTANTQDVIRVATPGTHPLFTRVNANGELEGYDIDVWEEIGRHLGKKIEWTQVAMEGAFGSLESGKVV